ncbi:Alpha/beta hydrolase nvfD-like protein [Cladobotryum mycophilum]|uniref:Alpha/beta hydrolase nvfD-like protein n=1 Tax=Cladobotryum mycophilum TaxID=491253 RepID=A0ABR0T471_9HYPO
MASSLPKPALLLIQGSFQLPQVYGKLVAALATRYPVVVHPALPSLSDPDEPGFASKTLATDALAIQQELERLVSEDRTVIVLAHSYGGLVASEAIPEELTWTARRKAEKTGGVLHLFLFSAFILTEGQSVLGVFGESPNNNVKPGGRFAIKNAGATLYSDLCAEDAQYWESKIIDQSYAVQTTELSRASYRYISSTYVITEIDNAVPVQYQKMFAKTARSETLLKIHSGHSPMLSKTDELVNLIDITVKLAYQRVGLLGNDGELDADMQDKLFSSRRP